jgi:enoyl-CoA hydratase
LEQGIRHERRLFHMLSGTQDKAEGMAAFIERRDPVWTGR